MGVKYNPYSLEGKTVLITGASSGIGQETAVQCSKLGAKVVITGRDAERLKQTYDMLEGDGHIQILANFDKDEDIERMVEEIPELDGVVNNAGMSKGTPITYIKKSDIDEVFRVNLYSVMLFTRLLVKKKKLARGGSLVFTSSISSRVTAAGIAIYASSKAALSAYMRNCAIELGPRGIRANAVLPGMVETKLIENGKYTEEDKQADLTLYPLGRYGRPEDVAYLMIYLLSDASAWMTGSELVIDGGRCLK